MLCRSALLFFHHSPSRSSLVACVGLHSSGVQSRRLLLRLSARCHEGSGATEHSFQQISQLINCLVASTNVCNGSATFLRLPLCFWWVSRRLCSLVASSIVEAGFFLPACVRVDRRYGNALVVSLLYAWSRARACASETPFSVLCFSAERYRVVRSGAHSVLGAGGYLIAFF